MNTKDRQDNGKSDDFRGLQKQTIVEEVMKKLLKRVLVGLAPSRKQVEETILSAITLTEQKAKDEIIRKIDEKIDGHSEQLKNTKEAGIILNIENRILSLKELKQSVKE